MHLLDEEELAHVGKILRKGYVRIHRPKKKEKVIRILFCTFFICLALSFLALGAYCIYWVVNGSHLFVAFPGFIISAALLGVSLREIHLSLENYTLSLRSNTYVKTVPNFIPDPDEPVDSSSYQSSTASSHNQSSHSFKSEETTSTFKPTSDDEVVKYSTFEQSVQFGKAPNMIRSVSQYEVNNVSSQDHSTAETVAQSSFSSSRKRFSHLCELEEGFIEMKTLPVLESSKSIGTKEVDRCSFQSLPAIKFMSKVDS